MVTFNKHTTMVVWIFYLTKLNGRQRDKFFQSHGTLRVNAPSEGTKHDLLTDDTISVQKSRTRCLGVY